MNRVFLSPIVAALVAVVLVLLLFAYPQHREACEAALAGWIAFVAAGGATVVVDRV